MADLFRKSPDGELFVLALHNCTTSTLAAVLNPAVSFVCIRDHIPNLSEEWWSTRVPIAVNLETDVEVSSMRYNVQMTTARFLELLPVFSDGINLAQFERRISPALLHDTLPVDKRNRIWKANGLFLKFTLPHEHETAVVACVDRAYLEAVAARVGGEEVPS